MHDPPAPSSPPSPPTPRPAAAVVPVLGYASAGTGRPPRPPGRDPIDAAAGCAVVGAAVACGGGTVGLVAVAAGRAASPDADPFVSALLLIAAAVLAAASAACGRVARPRGSASRPD